MPYVKPREIPFIRISRLLRGYGSAPELAAQARMSAPTMRRRLDNPASLTLGELRDLSLRLHIPKDEVMEAIKW